MSSEIDMPNEAVERHEHAEKKGGRITLLILLLAMGAAIAGKISAENEIRYLTLEIERSDTWAQYQGKSDRAAFAEGMAQLAEVLPNAADPKVQAAIAGYRATADRLNHDSKDGKEQLASHAKGMEAERDRVAHRMESFSVVVVLLALAIGLGSASMLAGALLHRRTLVGISVLLGAGAGLYAACVMLAVL